MAWYPSGSEFAVPDQTGSSDAPQITTLANGNFVVTWPDNSGTLGDSSGLAIHAKILDPSGAVVKDEFLVNTQTANNQMDPTITALSTGGFVVTWQGQSGLEAKIFDAGGNVVEDEFTAASAAPATVAELPNGFVTTYDNNSLFEIDAKIFDNSGGVVKDQYPLQQGTNGSVESSALLNNTFVSVWSYSTVGGGFGNSNISAEIFDDSGNVVHSAFGVNAPTGHVSHAGLGGVATLTNGDFVVIWDDGSLKGKIYAPDGTVVRTDFVLDTQPFGSAIAALSNGDFVVVGRDDSGTLGDSSNSAVAAEVFAPDGSVLQNRFLVNTTTAGYQMFPDVTALQNGGFVVTWQDNSAGTNSPTVKAQIYNFAASPTLMDDSQSVSDSPTQDLGIVIARGNALSNDSVPQNFTLTVSGAKANADSSFSSLTNTGVQVHGQYGDLNIQADGTYAYIPNSAFDALQQGQAASDVFQYQVSDGHGNTGSANITINITGSNEVASNTSVVGGPGANHWTLIASGNFDHQNGADLFWKSLDNGNTSLWLMGDSGLIGNPSTPNANGWDVLTTGDVNGDGTPDILWKAASTGDTSLWLMGPSGLIGNPSSPNANGWTAFATGDFNGDGAQDVLLKSAAGDTSLWLLGPNGLKGNPATPNVSGLSLQTTGDFNGDGRTDLLLKSQTTGDLSLWLMGPNGVQSTPAVPNVNGWNLAASGDFNGDGKTDLLWEDPASGNTSLWLMNGNGLMANPSTPNVNGWTLAATGDFNGDHKTDLLWKAQGSGDTSLWLMGDQGMIGNPATPNVNGWNLAAKGDFNHDGITDLLWTTPSGASSEWLMSNQGTLGSNPVTPLTNGLSELVAADLTGNGTTDVVWQQTGIGGTNFWMSH